ncbi:DUF4219 domain-containing protein, partial [Cephalotus follicularis]
FDGNNYSHWKSKMTIFIQSLDYSLWDLIVDGPNLPITTNESGATIPKPKTNYNYEDRKKAQMNARGKHVLICVISSNDFNRKLSRILVKKMLDRLEVIKSRKPKLESLQMIMKCLSCMKMRILKPCSLDLQILQMLYKHLIKLILIVKW